MASATRSPERARQGAAALAAGLLFGLGLAISGMTNPDKVRDFLDVFGRWDPSLAVVMAGAVATTFVGYRFVLAREHPLFDARFHLSTRREVDRRLLGGAFLFGIGWGVGGYCPGPAIASLAFGSLDALLFVAAMLAGMVLVRAIRHAAATT
jgi:uncharacterized membrane protein YedE/YeeE